jgi:hypothetical protein
MHVHQGVVNNKHPLVMELTGPLLNIIIITKTLPKTAHPIPNNRLVENELTLYLVLCGVCCVMCKEDFNWFEVGCPLRYDRIGKEFYIINATT